MRVSWILGTAYRLRCILYSPSATLDVLLGALAAAVGLWLCLPGWVASRHPGVASSLAGIAPVGAWGAVFLLQGLMVGFGVLYKRLSVVAGCHVFGFGLWLFLGAIMCFRHIPPMIGFLCPVIGVFSAVRLSQIPHQDH